MACCTQLRKRFAQRCQTDCAPGFCSQWWATAATSISRSYRCPHLHDVRASRDKIFDRVCAGLAYLEWTYQLGYICEVTLLKEHTTRVKRHAWSDLQHESHTTKVLWRTECQLATFSNILISHGTQTSASRVCLSRPSATPPPCVDVFPFLYYVSGLGFLIWRDVGFSVLKWFYTEVT